MFNEKQLELLAFATQFLISNLDDGVEAILHESTGLEPQDSEPQLQYLLRKVNFRKEELGTIEQQIDVAKRRGVWPDWQAEVVELINAAKYRAVENLNYDLAAHFRDVKNDFQRSLIYANQHEATLKELDKMLPSDTKVGHQVHESLTDTVEEESLEQGKKDAGP